MGIRHHRVLPGEQLIDLARCYYGMPTKDAALYIWQHNRDIIPDPNQLYPGQHVAIPHNPKCR